MCTEEEKLNKETLEKFGITPYTTLITSFEKQRDAFVLMNHFALEFVCKNKDNGMTEQELLERFNARVEGNPHLKSNEWILITANGFYTSIKPCNYEN